MENNCLGHQEVRKRHQCRNEDEFQFLTGFSTSPCTDGCLGVFGKHLPLGLIAMLVTEMCKLSFLQERIQADEVITILDQEQQGKHQLNINPKDEL